MEHGIAELAKIYIGFMLILTVVSAGLFMFQVQDVNTFKQSVNYQIERSGGLTTEAVNNINKYSKENFGGKYTIKSSQLNKKLDYGSQVDYQVIATIPIVFLPIPDVNLVFGGNSVSQIR